MLRTGSIHPNGRRLLAILLVSCVLGAAAACTGRATEEPPGVGAKAERGYQACGPIIAALAQYHQAHGAYPDSLDALVPDYLAAVPAEVNSEPLRYNKRQESYTLSFSYIGPGMNSCTYSPEEEWHCSGAY